MITVNVIIQSVKCKVFIFLARFLTSITPAWSKIIEITQKSNYDLLSSSGEASAPAALRTEAKAAILPRIPLSKAAGTHTHTHTSPCHSTGLGPSLQQAFTFLVHCLTVLTSSEMTMSTHFWHGSLIFPICLFTMVSKAMSGVKSPVLPPERTTGAGEKEKEKLGGYKSVNPKEIL